MIQNLRIAFIKMFISFLRSFLSDTCQEESLEWRLDSAEKERLLFYNKKSSRDCLEKLKMESSFSAKSSNFA